MTSFIRLARWSIPPTILLTTLYCFDDLKVGFRHIFAAQKESHVSNKLFDQTFPITNKWDDNWDSRDPLSLLDQDEYDEADDEKRREMLTKVRSKSTRNLYLIRHGQYHLENDRNRRLLTELGREQAELIGRRLASSGIDFDKLVMSTLIRATETANIIAEELSEKVVRISDSLLEEGAPYPPEPDVTHWRPQHKEFLTDGARIEAAFRKYVHRASSKQKNDSHELIVCHANVIRYFVCRALQFPPEGWLRISLANCSITWLVIQPNGRVVIKSLGDAGHLSSQKTTFT